MEKIVLVHLSDIHFTGSSGTSVYDLDSEVRNEILRDAATVTKELGGATGVLVTGDIAFSGQRTEYERAASWLLEFCRAIGCPDESVWVVPGNHDVDRKVANSKVTRTLHESVRAKQGPALDKELREILTDENSANALLAPLAEYNTFAARFQCSISAAKPYWERDLSLPCGTIIRLRGLCSALVSNQHDAKNNIVLGQAQVNVQRVEGVEYLTLCHHPACGPPTRKPTSCGGLKVAAVATRTGRGLRSKMPQRSSRERNSPILPMRPWGLAMRRRSWNACSRSRRVRAGRRWPLTSMLSPTTGLVSGRPTSTRARSL